jgi:hypothetical protein
MYRLITILLAVSFLPLKAQEPGDDVFATDQILKVELSFSQSGFWDSLVNNYSSETYMKADVTITDLTGVPSTTVQMLILQIRYNIILMCLCL